MENCTSLYYTQHRLLHLCDNLHKQEKEQYGNEHIISLQAEKLKEKKYLQSARASGVEVDIKIFTHLHL
jgi:Leu/Phe-tRNA-protein transferase